jgi:hypothetical protein
MLLTVCITQGDCHMTWKPKLIFKNIPLTLISQLKETFYITCISNLIRLWGGGRAVIFFLISIRLSVFVA